MQEWFRAMQMQEWFRAMQEGTGAAGSSTTTTAASDDAVLAARPSPSTNASLPSRRVSIEGFWSAYEYGRTKYAVDVIFLDQDEQMRWHICSFVGEDEELRARNQGRGREFLDGFQADTGTEQYETHLDGHWYPQSGEMHDLMVELNHLLSHEWW